MGLRLARGEELQQPDDLPPLGHRREHPPLAGSPGLVKGATGPKDLHGLRADRLLAGTTIKRKDRCGLLPTPPLALGDLSGMRRLLDDSGDPDVGRPDQGTSREISDQE